MSEFNSRQDPPVKKRRRFFTAERKLEIVAYSKAVSIKDASKKYNVDRKNIRSWNEKEEGLQELCASGQKHARQLRGSGRPLKNKDFDNALALWVRTQRQQKLRVSRHVIQREAQRLANIYSDNDNVDFKASEGWLQKFLARHGFSTRRPTTCCQKPPVEYEEKLISFILYLADLRLEQQFDYIYAADETSVALNLVGGLCVDEKGAKEVSVLTTGHEKMNITVMLTARSDGFKRKPFVLLNRKRQDPEIIKTYKNTLNLCWQGKTWMDDMLTEDYLRRTFGPDFFHRRLLVWDSFRCHISENTEKILNHLKLKTAVIPGGCTKFIQAPDVCWNQPFKAKIKQLFDDWMSTGEKSLTKGGNTRPPSIHDYLRNCLEKHFE